MRDESGGRRKIRINGFLSHVSTMAKMSKLCLKIRAKQKLESSSQITAAKTPPIICQRGFSNEKVGNRKN